VQYEILPHILWSKCASIVIQIWVSANLPSIVLLYLVVWCALCSVKTWSLRKRVLLNWEHITMKILYDAIDKFTVCK